MRTNHLSLAIIASLISLTTFAAPRLTVAVVVDGMRQETLDQLRPYWQQGGLRTLSEEAYQTTVRFPHIVYGGSECVATFMTGTTPSEHGIAADTYFRRSDRKPHAILEDSNEQGIGCNAALSPRNLLSATIGDELRIRYGERAHIYALGLDANSTILMAGHAADGCCWLDAATANWVSTSYYGEQLPLALSEWNAGTRRQELLARTWTPRIDIDLYSAPTEQEKKKGFSYAASVSESSANSALESLLLRTPMANTMVIESALALQKQEHLGEDNIPDLLCLHLSTRSPLATTDQLCSAEQEDMYLWLNQDLGYLIDQLARIVGVQHLRIVVMGKPLLGQNTESLAAARMPAQYFNVDRAAALTATYLMALYGTERWVDGGYGQSVYLNRTLIEQKHIPLPQLQQQVAAFLMDFEGVEAAFPFTEALGSVSLANTVNKRAFGDVVFTLQPHWLLKANDNTVLDHVVEEDPIVPVMIWSGAYQAFPTGINDATQIKALMTGN